MLSQIEREPVDLDQGVLATIRDNTPIAERSRAQTGAVTLIQRFGGALNLNIHFHMLFLDGVHLTGGRRLRFAPLPAPTPAALQGLLKRIAHRTPAARVTGIAGRPTAAPG